MPKKKALTINQRLKNEIDRWTELKNSYPKDGYQTIEEHLKNDENFLEEYFGFVNIVKSAKKRNYINKNKALDIMTSISHYPYGDVLDAINDEIYKKNRLIYYHIFS